MNNKRRTVISLPNVQRALANSSMEEALRLPPGSRILGILRTNGLAIPLVLEVTRTGLKVLRDQFNESQPLRDFSGWVTDDAKRF